MSDMFGMRIQIISNSGKNILGAKIQIFENLNFGAKKTLLTKNE